MSRPPCVSAAEGGRIETWGPYDIPAIGLRRARVYVPPGEARRPVAVLFDGQNVFDDEGSFGGGWRAHAAADRVATRRRPAPVIAALDHGHAERINELSPFPVQLAAGRLDQLAAFIAEQFAADIRARLDVAPDPSQWIIGGSSMGGLAALYTHFALPGAFGGAMCLSPSLWVARGRIFGWLQSRPNPAPSRIYLDCGAREGEAMMRLARSMADRLRARGYGPQTLCWRADPRGTHHETSWGRRLPGALRFLLRVPSTS